MTEPLKFFKVDDSTIYQDGFTYSFHRNLDPPTSSADIELHQVFYCALKEEENCRSRCHVTGNWEMDKKGRKFMLGIVKKGDHTHGQEYRDTTPTFKFYKNDDESIHRNGFDYNLYRYLDPPKQIAGFEWNPAYRCSMSDQENCRARIYTTGQWEVNKRGEEYQRGIFKNCIHSHELDKDSTEQDEENNSCNKIATPSSTRNEDQDKKEQVRLYKYKETSLQHNGFVYSYQKDVKSHPRWRKRMGCRREINGKHTCNGYVWTTGKWRSDNYGRKYQTGIVMAEHDHDPYQLAFQGKDNDDETSESGLKFYQYMDKYVHRDGHVYTFQKYLKSNPPWKHRMRCTRRNQVNKKQFCTGSIWTSGEWEIDKLGRYYQRGILRGGHSHKAYEQFLNEDDTAFVGNGGPMDHEFDSANSVEEVRECVVRS